MLKISIFYFLSWLIASGLFQPNSDQSDYEKKKNYIVLSVIYGTRSHAKPMLYIGEEMSKRGHEVVYMATPSTLQLAKGFNIPTIPLKTPPNMKSVKMFTHNTIDKDALKLNGYSDEKIEKLEEEMIIFRKKAAEQMSIATSISTVFRLFINEAYEIAVFGLLDAFEKRRPDLVICDFLGMACMDVCAHLHIPYMISVFSLAYIDHPDLPKYIPNQHIGRSFFSITFWERFYDKFIFSPHLLALIFPTMQQMNRIRTKYGLQTYYNPQTNIAHRHILVTCFIGWNIPHLMSPFIHTVGSIVGEKELEKEIPNDLFHWLEEARTLNESVIYVAFGSIAIPSRDHIKVLLDGFFMDSSCTFHEKKDPSSLRILWSLSGLSLANFPLETINKNDGYNIRFEEWVPQLTVLAHASVKLFVTHGGVESIHEVLYVGKPSIIVPFFGDQHANAVLSRDRGLGDFLNKDTMTSIDICKKVHNLIIDYGNRSSQLYQNLYKMSRIVHYNLDNYKQIYNVLEMEIEIGSQHLIPPSVSWFVAHDADLWTTFFAIIAILIYAIWFAYKKLCSKQKDKIKLN